MNITACSAVNTCFKIAKTSHIFRLTKITYPAFTYFLHQGFDIRVCAAVIYYLNLHVIRPGILGKHREDIIHQVLTAIIGRNHDRPQGSFDMIGNW